MKREPETMVPVEARRVMEVIAAREVGTQSPPPC
jgi:hypothetical protein